MTTSSTNQSVPSSSIRRPGSAGPARGRGDWLRRISPAALAGAGALARGRPPLAPGRRSRSASSLLGQRRAGIVWFWGAGGADGLGYHWHSFDAALIGLGRLTALLAGYLALIEVLLLARLPFLERARRASTASPSGTAATATP